MSRTEYLLSFDVAHKSLAVCLLEVVSWTQPVQLAIASILLDPQRNSKEKLQQCMRMLAGARVLHLEVINLLGAKKVKDTSLVERGQALRAALSRMDSLVEHLRPHVLVEYQMSANDKSRLQSAQILYHYTALPVQVHLVGPSLKQSVRFGSQSIRDFLATHRSNYCANKAHSRSLLKSWAAMYDPQCIRGIPAKHMDDAADAFLMAIAWYAKQSQREGRHYLL